jgi:hypothetical protein
MCLHRAHLVTVAATKILMPPVGVVSVDVWWTDGGGAARATLDSAPATLFFCCKVKCTVPFVFEVE